MELCRGKRLGRYEIVAELGRGAMGVVYKARDPRIDRFVALKTISLAGLERGEKEEFSNRFRYEAKAAGALQHPSIVTVYDLGEDRESGEAYIVFEYVEGEPLSRILSREKKLPIYRALAFAEELANALDYAHGRGVVHRDIKPANILIHENGHAKIGDFGIAKLDLSHVTLPGRVLGTPAFMSPEQLNGDTVDGRSDIFSLGVVLYVMVVGHLPFQGNSATTVCFKVVNREPVPVTSFDLDLPEAVDTVIGRAMAKEPTERYKRGADLAADLRKLREHLDTESAAPVRWNTGSRALTKTRNGLQLRGVNSSRHGGNWPAMSTLATWITAVGLVITLGLLIGAFHQPSGTRKDMTAVPMLAVPAPVPLESSPDTHQNAIGADPHTSAGTELEAPKSSVLGPRVSDPKKNLAKSAARQPRVSAQTGTQSLLRPATVTPAAVAVTAPVATQSALELSVVHEFKEATLWVWVDDGLVLTQDLHAAKRSHLLIFGDTRGADSDTLRISSGMHSIRVRVQNADHSIDLSKTVSAEFTDSDDKTLAITFAKHNSVMMTKWVAKDDEKKK
jgi:serine/threonine protein kinase